MFVCVSSLLHLKFMFSVFKQYCCLSLLNYHISQGIVVMKNNKPKCCSIWILGLYSTTREHVLFSTDKESPGSNFIGKGCRGKGWKNFWLIILHKFFSYTLRLAKSVEGFLETANLNESRITMEKPNLLVEVRKFILSRFAFWLFYWKEMEISFVLS